MSDERSDAHFGIAGILVSLSWILGMGYLMSGFVIARLPPSYLILTLLAVTAVSIVYGLEESIRTIGRGHPIGWGLLLGHCFYAVVITPVCTIHVALALGSIYPQS